MRSITLLSLLGFILLTGCDEQGLNPNDVSEPGFGGSITFVSKLPPTDSLTDLRIVAVPYFPVDTLFQPLIIKVIEGIIPFGENIVSKADSGKTITYEMFVKPQTYYYLAIVQQYGIDVFSQWKVVGVFGYVPSQTQSKIITVPDGKFIRDVNFTVDFYQLPPQPFKLP